jgi:hypothetical protein
MKAHRAVAIATLTALIGTSVGAQALAAPARRGPTVTVIRPDADTFPNRPRLESRGPIRVAEVVSDAWVGPRLDDAWRPSSSGEATAQSWFRVERSEWDQLRADRDRRFEMFGDYSR